MNRFGMGGNVQKEGTKEILWQTRFLSTRSKRKTNFRLWTYPRWRGHKVERDYFWWHFTYCVKFFTNYSRKRPRIIRDKSLIIKRHQRRSLGKRNTKQ